MYKALAEKSFMYPSGMTILPNEEYLIDDQNVGLFTTQYDLQSKVEFFDPNNRKFDINKNYNQKGIFIIRAGGFGDLLLITPILRQLKKLWPECVITVASVSAYWDALENNPHVDWQVGYPVPTQMLNSVNIIDINEAVVTLDGMLEDNLSKKMHATDCALSRFPGLVLDSYETEYYPTEDELKQALAKKPRTYRKRIGIQMRTSSETRNWPVQQIVEVMDALSQKHDMEIFVFDVPNGSNIMIRDEQKNKVVNVSAMWTSFRESAALLKTCDALLGLDSGLTHLAGAMKIPCVALYAAMPSELRVKHQKTTKVLHGKLPCAPCFKGGPPFPMNQPCAQTNKCEALAAIHPQTVINEILKMVNVK